MLADQVGLNHLSWVRAVWLDGVDMLPGLLAEHAERLAGEAGGVPVRLLEELGAVPSYYLRYFYEHDRVLAEQRDGVPRATTVAEIEDELLELYRDPGLDREAGFARATRRGVLQRGGARAARRALLGRERDARRRSAERGCGAGPGRRRRGGDPRARRRWPGRAAPAEAARAGAARARPARDRLRAARGRGRAHRRPGRRAEGAARASAGRAVRAGGGARRAPARPRARSICRSSGRRGPRERAALRRGRRRRVEDRPRGRARGRRGARRSRAARAARRS